MFDDRRSRRVGAVAIVATIAAMVAVLTVDCGGLRPGFEVTVYLAHAGALTEGADLMVAGQVIGRVDRVEAISAEAAAAADHPLHPGGGAALHVRVERRRAGWASADGIFFVASRGVLGEPYLAAGPPPGGAPGQPLAAGDRIRGIDPVRLEQVMLRSLQNTAAFRRVLDQVGPSARALRTALEHLETSLADLELEDGAWSELATAIGGVRREAGRLGDLFGAGELSGERLRALATAAAATGGRLDAALTRLGAALDAVRGDLDRVRETLPTDLVARLDRAMAGARAAAATAEAILVDGRALAADLAQGRGTVGALLRDPEFIDDAKRLGRILKRQPWRIFGRDPDRPASTDDD